MTTNLLESVHHAVKTSQHVLLVGAAGSGKTLLARRIAALVSARPLDEHTALQVGRVWWASGLVTEPTWTPVAPFRAPHHTVSVNGMGGTWCCKCQRWTRYGELTLAHGGVLFLDEVEEFPRRVLDTLREPLETGCIALSTALQPAPARFQLVMAGNNIDAIRTRVPMLLLEKIDVILNVTYEDSVSAATAIDAR